MHARLTPRSPSSSRHFQPLSHPSRHALAVQVGRPVAAGRPSPPVFAAIRDIDLQNFGVTFQDRRRHISRNRSSGRWAGMSTHTLREGHSAAASALPDHASSGDRLSASIVSLLVMTLLQRLVGFVRGLLVCRLLPPEQLGQWDLALGFLELTAPIVVLGIPGSFGRYVEHYRQRGMLRTFVRRATFAAGALVAIAVVLFAFHPDLISLLIYGSTAQRGTVEWMSLALAGVIAYYFSNTLLVALRRSRVVQRLEFFNSIVFAGVAIALIYGWRADASSVVLAYAIAALAAAILSARVVRRIWSTLPDDSETLPHAALWRRVLPFALAVWGTNWLANAFELADRYMIVHTGGWPIEQALAVLGNYHSSRVFPLLLVSITGSLATIMLPYLSHDWERGQRDAVAAQLNLTCKLLAILLTAAAIAIRLIAPVLFGKVLLGKYADGLGVLPWTLGYSIWFGLARVMQKYLWCAQRVRLAALAWSGGLAVNVLLNLVLLPRFGLNGVVWATAAGNVAALGLVLLLSRLAGLHLARGIGLAVALPASVVLPLPAALAAFVGALFLVGSTDRMFSVAEKARFNDILDGYRARLAGRFAASVPQHEE